MHASGSILSTSIVLLASLNNVVAVPSAFRDLTQPVLVILNVQLDLGLGKEAGQKSATKTGGDEKKESRTIKRRSRSADTKPQ